MNPEGRRYLVVLTGERERPHFHLFLKRQNPEIIVTFCESLEQLEAAVLRRNGAVRILAFLTDLIVPGWLLGKLAKTPYNIHPGPPGYPGSHPESFALWNGERTYGVTAHEMTTRVDEGPIVHVDRFDIPEEARRSELADLTYQHAVNLFARIGAHCASSDADLPRVNIDWTGSKRTKADFSRLCRPPAGLLPADYRCLQRACGADYEPPALCDIGERNLGPSRANPYIILRGAVV